MYTEGPCSPFITHPSLLYEASTMLGELYALEVTQVQWTANIISIMRSATSTMLRTLAPIPSPDSSPLLDFLSEEELEFFSFLDLVPG
jgi:hypothetical protein